MASVEIKDPVHGFVSLCLFPGHMFSYTSNILNCLIKAGAMEANDMRISSGVMTAGPASVTWNKPMIFSSS